MPKPQILIIFDHLPERGYENDIAAAIWEMVKILVDVEARIYVDALGGQRTHIVEVLDAGNSDAGNDDA